MLERHTMSAGRGDVHHRWKDVHGRYRLRHGEPLQPPDGDRVPHRGLRPRRVSGRFRNVLHFDNRVHGGCRLPVGRTLQRVQRRMRHRQRLRGRRREMLGHRRGVQPDTVFPDLRLCLECHLPGAFTLSDSGRDVLDRRQGEPYRSGR